MTYSLLTPISPKVEVIDGVVVTTSLAIAEYFGKRHDNIVAAIRDQLAQVPDSFSDLNFQDTHYLDKQGKKRPMYHVTKDGFIFLVMGFTGREAAQIKVAYITAFNQMEAQLRTQSPSVESDTEHALMKKCIALQEKLLEVYEQQLQPKPKRATPHRLTNEAIRQIRSLHEQGYSQKDIANLTSYSTATVSFVVRQGVSDE